MVPNLPALIGAGLEAMPLQALAAAARVPVTALSAAQSGQHGGWSVAMIARLARAVGADPTEVLAGGGVPAPRLLAFLTGNSATLDARDLPAIRGALARAHAATREGLLPATRYTPTRPPASHAYQAGYRAAQRVRRDVGRVAAPITELRPLVEGRLGVWVELAPLVGAADAIAVADARGAAVVLNRASPGTEATRRRSLAHEVCHVLFDPRDDGALFDSVGPRDLDRTEQDRGDVEERREQRARAFAAELLVPKAALERRWRGPLTPSAAEHEVSAVAEEFGAPWDLTVYHALNHGFLDSATADLLLATRPPVACSGVVGGSAARITATTRVAEGDLSEGRAREIFGEDWAP